MGKLPCRYCNSIIDSQKEFCPFCGKQLDSKSLPGTTLYGSCLQNNRYTIGHILDSDGQGITYEGYDCQKEHRVSILEYRPSSLCESRSDGAIIPEKGKEVLFKTCKMDFTDLFGVLKNITPSVGLQTVWDVFEENGTVYTVLELLDGQSLEQYASKRKKISVSDARSKMQQIFEGVATMHKAGLLHAGVSPQNIFLSRDGRSVLKGYAIPDLRKKGGLLNERLYNGFTAPELYTPEMFSGRYSDVYSLSAVFYYLLTENVPVDSRERLIIDHLDAASEVDNSVPGYISTVISQGMRLLPEERISSVDVLMGGLYSRKAAEQLLDEAKEKTQDNDGNPTRYYKIILGILLAICLLLISMCLFMFLQKQDKTTDLDSAGIQNSEINEIVVPSFIGSDLEKVQGDEHGFIFFITDWVYSDKPEGVIVEQNPLPGTIISEQYNIISLIVSKGEEIIRMPQIVGFTRDNAEASLNNLGIQFTLSVCENNNGQYVSGCIAYTDVEPGTIVSKDQIVNVYVAEDRFIDHVN